MKRLSSSIGLMQALTVLAASLVIGAVFSLVHLKHALDNERENAHSAAAELLTVTHRAATQAVWTLDETLARDVINSVVAMPGLRAARVTDDQGQALVSAGRDAAEPHVLRDWLGMWLELNDVNRSRKLYVEHLGAQRYIGELTVEIDGAFIVERFLWEVCWTGILTVLQAVLVGAVLLWISNRLVTGPLKTAASQIERIDPNLAEQTLKVPERHRGNELGQLVQHTNDMLSRLFAAQGQLRRLATRDPLTDLPNRAAIGEALHGALERAKRSTREVAVLFIDLDGFKEVNDVLGHEAGDALLLAIASALRDTVRGQDTLGRLGGDEFLVVLEDFESVESAVDAAARIAGAINAPFEIEGNEVRCSSSIGIALYPDDGQDVGTLMRHADLAMYRAKDIGGDSWVLFANEMSDRMRSRVATRAALDKALAEDELFLVFQPKFCKSGAALAGCEALLRWQRDGEVVSAAQFLEVAENTPQIVEIGKWVLDQACAQCSMWATDFEPVGISINISARQLIEPTFIDDVVAALDRYAVPPELIELEITETAAIADIGYSVDLLGRLHDLGVETSLDDFGTGYSSLSYLVQLPLSTVKIDRTFISGLHPSPDTLQAILAMTRALNLKTVAEGIETQEQLELVNRLGCDLVQGYYTGRPVKPDEFAGLYLSNRLLANGAA